jgi:hypothetical protein
MRLPLRFAVHNIALEFAAHDRGTLAARANEPDATAGKSLYRGDADLMSEALCNRLTLSEAEE